MHLAETGVITARGTLGSALAIEAHQPVYDGDQLTGWDHHWQRAREEFEVALELARTDRDTARGLLRMLTFCCTSPASFHRERQCLIDAGILEHFLPDSRELGRTDLLAAQA